MQRYDKSGRVYTMVKVSGQRKLVLKHRHVWEQFHGKKVPHKHKIIFKDGDTSNFDIENLECISYQDQMIKNSLHNYPQDLKEVIQTKGRLTRAINKHLNQQP